MAFLATEVAPFCGRVCREVGVNETEEIVHRFPSRGLPKRGVWLFDVQTIETTGLESNISREVFESLWGQK